MVQRDNILTEEEVPESVDDTEEEVPQSADDTHERVSQSVDDSLEDYFAQELHREEFHSICLVGCGEAGTKLAGIFRLKPDYVPAYLPKYFPVRAVTMDTQANLSDTLHRLVGWYEPEVQMAFDPPPPERIEDLLEGAGSQQQSNPGVAPGGAPTDPGIAVSRTGGAGGFTLHGRATALYNYGEDTDVRLNNTQILEHGRVISRTYNGYLVTFSGLGGGTGSGAVPVVVGYIQERMRPSPAATLSLCIVPEETRNVLGAEDLSKGDPRLLSNLLTSLYYLVTTPAINGIILADNLLLGRQGYKQFTSEINRYLQDILMPVFLSAQAHYHFGRHAVQLDPANVRRALAPRGDGRQELIAACFSIGGLPNVDKHFRNARQMVNSDPSSQVPDLKEMLKTALLNPTIECETDTARSALVLLSGPGWALEKMVPDVEFSAHFGDHLRQKCVSEENNPQGFARFFMAEFPEMTDVRLTVLLSAPKFPMLERGIQAALGDSTWGPRAGESLADALRRLEEPEIRRRGLTFMQGH